MLFESKSKKISKSIQGKIKESNLFMDNNYRDLARDAYNEAKEMIEQHKEAGDIKERDLKELSMLLDRCYTRITHMGHY